MQKLIKRGPHVILISLLLIGLASCSKEISATNALTAMGINSNSSTSSTIAVAADSSGTDSVYLLQPCERSFFRDSLAASALPQSIQTYLTANYPGYVFQKGFEIKDSSGTIGGYVVVITYNGKPVGLLFDASGNFQKVLEQREGGDMDGSGWHHGGRFCNRDGSHRDTIALTQIPAVITSYFAKQYPSDTLLHAFRNADSSILVISKNNGLFATVFTSSGVFVKRVALTPNTDSPNPPAIQNVLQDSLPANILSYLASTYPNYVFESALSFTPDGQSKGYLVVIDADNTKYAVWFDASGNLVATIPVW